MKKKLKIGIDIDDTIVDFFEDFIHFCNEDNGLDLTIQDLIERGFFGLLKTREEVVLALEKYVETGRIYTRDVFEDFLNSFDKIKCEDIFLITARSFDNPEKTKEFLKQKINGFDFRIYYVKDHPEKNKLAIAKELGLDLIIEDSPKEAKLCSNGGIQVFLIDKPWNQGVSHEKIIRVNNWKEIMDKLK